MTIKYNIQNQNNGILIFVEQSKHEIHSISYELLSKARELADQLEINVYAACISSDDLNLDELIYRGADKVYHLQSSYFNYPHELYYSEALTDLITRLNPGICLFGATKFGRSLAPRIAARLKTGITADCTDLQLDNDKTLIQIRPAFSDNILAHITTKTTPQIVTVRHKEFKEAYRDTNRQGEIFTEKYNLSSSDDKLIIKDKIKNEEVDITNASVVVAGGKGLQSSNDFNILQEFADLLGGTVGASRDAVEEGFISKEYQIGYSGNRVKPKLYFACGISGAPQHLAGMIESETIVAINKDSSSPIFQVADYGVIGDWRAVVKKLIDKINYTKAAEK